MGRPFFGNPHRVRFGLGSIDVLQFSPEHPNGRVIERFYVGDLSDVVDFCQVWMPHLPARNCCGLRPSDGRLLNRLRSAWETASADVVSRVSGDVPWMAPHRGGALSCWLADFLNR